MFNSGVVKTICCSNNITLNNLDQSNTKTAVAWSRKCLDKWAGLNAHTSSSAACNPGSFGSRSENHFWSFVLLLRKASRSCRAASWLNLAARRKANKNTVSEVQQNNASLTAANLNGIEEFDPVSISSVSYMSPVWWIQWRQHKLSLLKENLCPEGCTYIWIVEFLTTCQTPRQLWLKSKNIIQWHSELYCRCVSLDNFVSRKFSCFGTRFFG